MKRLIEGLKDLGIVAILMITFWSIIMGIAIMVTIALNNLPIK